MAYADDLTLVAENVEDLAHLLGIVEQFSRETGMWLSADKCVYTAKGDGPLFQNTIVPAQMYCNKMKKIVELPVVHIKHADF